MQPPLWIERKFNFDFPPDRWPVLAARLEGAYTRIEYLTHELPAALLTYAPGGKWSIQQHLGHLIDLEDLHLQRIDDFREQRSALSAWDTTNKKTELADHNNRSVVDLLADFDAIRTTLVRALSSISPSENVFTAMHPRLMVPMRPVDMAFFVAEHDDHHIAHIISILKMVNM